jgi:hypothetical protein
MDHPLSATPKKNFWNIVHKWEFEAGYIRDSLGMFLLLAQGLPPQPTGERSQAMMYCLSASKFKVV